MKALSLCHRQWQMRRQLASRRKQIRAAGVENHLRYMSSISGSYKESSQFIKAPKSFLLSKPESRQEMVEFIDRISDALSRGGKVILDFRETSDLHPCGTLYFVASVDVLIDLYPLKIGCRYPKDQVVEQLFQHIGLLQKLGQAARLQVTAKNVINWHFAAGVDATTNAFKSLLTQHQEAMGGLVTRSELYDCMSEAVTNTRKHAYPSKTDRRQGRWWMFSQADESTLTVVICDLGIGIPKSLMNKPEMTDYIRKLFMIGKPYTHDKALIEIATSSNRTSTGLPYRGKGLPQMLDFIKNGSVGGFRAQSGHGCYNYDAVQSKGRAITYHNPIKGTLIQWTLPLKT